MNPNNTINPPGTKTKCLKGRGSEKRRRGGYCEGEGKLSRLDKYWRLLLLSVSRRWIRVYTGN